MKKLGKKRAVKVHSICEESFCHAVRLTFDQTLRSCVAKLCYFTCSPDHITFATAESVNMVVVVSLTYCASCISLLVFLRAQIFRVNVLVLVGSHLAILRALHSAFLALFSHLAILLALHLAIIPSCVQGGIHGIGC